MKKIVFLIISIVIGVIIYYKNDEVIIPSDAIRIRIIANSNNIEDLYQKKKIKNEIKNDIYSLVENAKSSNEASDNISNNLDNIKKIVSSKTTDFKVDYGLNYFPSKTYKSVIYPEGNYESLVITLGKGLGDNWWCVLYPPLCMVEESDTVGDIEYRSLVADIINN